jgi:hypothetical protein
MLIARPDQTEYAPFFAGYISQVPDGDVLSLLSTQVEETAALLAGATEAQAVHRYAPGKWSVKEVIGHVADSERVFAYRALRFARNDRTPLPGFDENLFAAEANHHARPLSEILDELRLVRRATVALYRSFTAEMIARRGVSNEKELTVRAILYITAGHERHHVGILKERYLK